MPTLEEIESFERRAERRAKVAFVGFFAAVLAPFIGLYVNQGCERQGELDRRRTFQNEMAELRKKGAYDQLERASMNYSMIRTHDGLRPPYDATFPSEH